MNKKILGVVCLVLFSFSVQARINKETFNSGETLTAGKLFLNQVDAVSLYLSTQRIVYVPHLRDDMKLDVNLTLLGDRLTSDRATLQKLVTRHISTFNKTLMERLQYYTPQLAKEFNPNEDVEFAIKAGPEKGTVATWKSGKWTWVGALPSRSETKVETETAVATPAPAVVFTETKPKKRCPAMIGEPQEETTPVTEADAPASEAKPEVASVAPATAEPAPAPAPAKAPASTIPKTSKGYGVGQ